MTNILCPFCGENGRRTDEHVWAQWLHSTWGASELLKGTHGERQPLRRGTYKRGSDGRYGMAEEKSVSVAKWLPNVKVAVCGDCNNGWMSRLETATRALLVPFFENHRSQRFNADNCHTLASWATKSWMAYVLSRSPQMNPFTQAEYRAMAQDQSIPQRLTIWLMHSMDSHAHVAMSVKSGLMSHRDEPHDLEQQDNWGHLVLAAGSVVLFGALVPPALVDHPLAPSLFHPGTLADPFIRRIAPNPRPHYFPLGVLQPGVLSTLTGYHDRLSEAIGLPSEGLTEAEVAAVHRAFDEGVDPKMLRDLYSAKPVD